MGINNIKLPAQTIAELYGHSLIGEAKSTIFQPTIPISNETEATPAKASTVLKWLGNNEQKVLILVNNSTATFLPDKQLSFLTGILTACRLSIADVAILNIHHHPNLTYKEIQAELQSKNVVLFGIEPAAIELPINFPHYQLQQFTGTTYLTAPTLPELEDDKVEKSKLWVCLKKMFGI